MSNMEVFQVWGNLGACRELQQSLQQHHLHPSSTSQLKVCASTYPGSPWHPPKRDLLTDKEEQRGKSPFCGVRGLIQSNPHKALGSRALLEPNPMWSWNPI